MEILCETGDTRLDEMARVIIQRAAEGYPLPDEGRIVLSDTAADVREGDFLILLYRTQSAPAFRMQNGHMIRCRTLKRPYSIKELEDTVMQLLSAASTGAVREKTEHTSLPEPASAGETAVLHNRTVSLGGITVSLTKREAAVFGILYENRGTPVSRARLTEEVWGRGTETNLCDVYVCRLRTKLEPIFGKGFLTNLRNEGYMMV